MADVPNRDELEREIGRKLGSMLKRQMWQLLEYMGDPPDLSKVPESFWDESGAEFRDLVRPFLQRLFEDQARTATNQLNLGVDWTLINERAAAWASQYTFDLVTGLNATNRRLLQGAVDRYFRDGQTIGELENSIMGAFGPVRAEMIAVTEVTRAATQGERALMDELGAQGIHMRPIFHTNVDELVCTELCEPLNNKEITRDEDYPPLHPRCRCWTNLEYAQ